MKTMLKAGSVLLLLLLVAASAPALQTQVTPAGTAVSLNLDGADVITASDAGGGYLSNNDILLIVVCVLAVFGLIYLLH